MSETTTHPDSLHIHPRDWLGGDNLSSWWPGNDQPLWVDLGFGKGRFLLAHAAANREVRFLGVERKLKRVKKLDRKAVRAGLDHVRLLRCEGYYAVTYFLPENSVDKMYIYYPDPWPKDRHAHHRMLSPKFMDTLARCLKPGGEIQFSTDHEPYFQDVMEIWSRDKRFEPCEIYLPTDEETSDFELMFRDERPANRAALRLNP